jgi:SAM-dependent methyltransferase
VANCYLSKIFEFIALRRNCLNQANGCAAFTIPLFVRQVKLCFHLLATLPRSQHQSGSRSKMTAMPSSETEFWAHYQTEHVAVFAGSKTRLDFLVRLAGKLSSGRCLLNIGCGDGYLERRASEKSWTVISVDPDQSSVARLKALGIDARCGSIESLPAEPESIDVVISTEVFEHLSEEVFEAGLNQIRRVLKPRGLLIGTVPYREDLSKNTVFCPDCKKRFHRWGHQQTFDEARLESFLGRYFHVRKLTPVYFPTWNVADWKGKLSIAARLAFSRIGVHSDLSNILFVAIRGS